MAEPRTALHWQLLDRMRAWGLAATSPHIDKGKSTLAFEYFNEACIILIKTYWSGRQAKGKDILLRELRAMRRRLYESALHDEHAVVRALNDVISYMESGASMLPLRPLHLVLCDHLGFWARISGNPKNRDSWHQTRPFVHECCLIIEHSTIRKGIARSMLHELKTLRQDLGPAKKTKGGGKHWTSSLDQAIAHLESLT